MISQIPPGTTYAIHLRNPRSVSGGKDWIGCLVTGKPGIVVVHGSTVQISSGGGQVRLTTTPANAPNVRTVANKKISEGYQEIDRYDSVTGWESQRQARTQTPSVPDPPAKPAPKTKLPAPVKNFLSDTDGGDAPETWFW